jgi:hypothetical protein
MQARFEPNRLTSYDEASILSEIRRVVQSYFDGRVPRKADFDRHSRVKSWAIRRRFGSWANAIQRAGFAYEGVNYAGTDLRRSKFVKAEMVRDLQRVKDLNEGYYFTQAYYQRHGGRYAVKTLKKYFGCCWPELLEATLVISPPHVVRTPKSPTQPRKRVSEFSRNDLFVELKRVWDSLGRRPLYAEFKRLGKIGVKVYEREFGSWTSAIEWFSAAPGYSMQGSPGAQTTGELLLADLRAIVQRSSGQFLTFKKYRETGGTYSIGTFRNRFGSWKAAVEKLGLRDGHAGLYADDQLFAELQRLWEAYGRQPTYKDMNRDGAISGNVFQWRFGSWMKAVHAFCDDRQARDEEVENPEAEGVNQSLATTVVGTQAVVTIGAAAETVCKAEVATPRAPGRRLRFRVFQRDKFRCVICGQSPRTCAGLELHIDHVTPYSRGGASTFENLQTLCKDCNLGKSNTME